MVPRERYTGASLVRWGPIVAGAVIAIGVMALLGSFWAALAYGSDTEAVRDNLHWFGLVSAIIALLAGGFLAGWLSGVRGMGVGLLHGLTVWALALVVALAYPFLGQFGLFNFAPEVEGAGPWWAGFLSLLIGAVAASVGGVLGGGSARPAELFEPMGD